MRAAGVLKDYVPEEQWARHRGVLDIDGRPGQARVNQRVNQRGIRG